MAGLKKVTKDIRTANRLGRERTKFLVLKSKEFTDPQQIPVATGLVAEFKELSLFDEALQRLDEQFPHAGPPIGGQEHNARGDGFLSKCQRLLHEFRWLMENRYPNCYKPCWIRTETAMMRLLGRVSFCLAILLPNTLDPRKGYVAPGDLGPVLSTHITNAPEVSDNRLVQPVLDLAAALNWGLFLRQGGTVYDLVERQVGEDIDRMAKARCG